MVFRVSYHMSLPYVPYVSAMPIPYVPLYVVHVLLPLNLPVLLSPLGANLGEQLLHCTFGLSFCLIFFCNRNTRKALNFRCRYIYRPQGKVMFSETCVILFTGERGCGSLGSVRSLGVCGPWGGVGACGPYGSFRRNLCGNETGSGTRNGTGTMPKRAFQFLHGKIFLYHYSTQYEYSNHYNIMARCTVRIFNSQ